MGLIIHPSEADRRKTFYATKIQPYSTVGVKRGHFSPIIAAALCLPAAMHNQCDDVVVCPEGMRPIKFSVKHVQECVRKYPLYFKSFLPQKPKTQGEATRQKLLFQHQQRTNTGLFLVER